MNVRSVLTLIVILCLAAPANAQGGDPESIAEQYFLTIKSEGMASVSKFMHPTALEEFKSTMLPVFEIVNDSGQHEFSNAVFGSSVSIADVRAMDSGTFMSGFMNFIVQQIEGLNIAFDKIEILGSIEEGEATHVLSRITVGAGQLSVTNFEVLSFLPYKNSWRLQLNAQIKGLAQSIRASILDQ